MDAFRQHVIYITADDDLYQEVVLVVEAVSGV